jgi:hypothetical protein
MKITVKAINLTKIEERKEGTLTLHSETPYKVFVEAQGGGVSANFTVDVSRHRHKQRRERELTIEEITASALLSINRFCSEVVKPQKPSTQN